MQTLSFGLQHTLFNEIGRGPMFVGRRIGEGLGPLSQIRSARRVGINWVILFHLVISRRSSTTPRCITLSTFNLNHPYDSIKKIICVVWLIRLFQLLSREVGIELQEEWSQPQQSRCLSTRGVRVRHRIGRFNVEGATRLLNHYISLSLIGF